MKVDEKVTINALVEDVVKISEFLKDFLKEYPTLKLHENSYTILDNKSKIDSSVETLTHELLNEKMKVLNTLIYDIKSNYGLSLINVDELLEQDTVRIYISEWDCDLEGTKNKIKERYGDLKNIMIKEDPDYETIMEFKFNYNTCKEDKITHCQCRNNTDKSTDTLKTLLDDIRLKNRVLYHIKGVDGLHEDFLRLNRDYMIYLNTFVESMQRRFVKEYKLKSNYSISIRDKASFLLKNEAIEDKELLICQILEDFQDWSGVIVESEEKGIGFNIDLTGKEHII